jgi:hypothetical protein
MDLSNGQPSKTLSLFGIDPPYSGPIRPPIPIESGQTGRGLAAGDNPA